MHFSSIPSAAKLQRVDVFTILHQYRHGKGQTEYLFAVHDDILLLHILYLRSYAISRNIFGWALSYRQMTYEWKVLNIRQARKAVFDTALLHFGLFAFCCFCYWRQAQAGGGSGWFSSVSSSQQFQDSIPREERAQEGYEEVHQLQS